MQRFLGYAVASMVSVIGWKLGMLAGPMMAFFVALVFAGVGLYLTRRWLSSVLN